MIKKHYNIKTVFLIFSALAILIGSSCRRDRIFTDTSASLNFSNDTIVFDTVFVTIGSTFRRFTVRNPYNQTVIVDRVRLKSGTSSAFRINVDGVPTVDVRDIEIGPRDSIFVFAEVTVDPNNSLNDFVIEDEIIFTTNGNDQSVVLAAWGRNAYFHFNEVNCNETWLNDKPHVLYGITAVGFPGIDSNCFLNIPDGTEIYAHNDAVLFVYKSSLNINGTEGNEVLFRGDRLEAAFDDVPGQWFGIRMFQPQTSLIEHTIITNGTVGLLIDTIDGSDQVNLNYVASGNHTFASLMAQGSNVRSENSLYYDAGVYTTYLNVGGRYNFNHCTFTNFWTNTTRTTPLVFLKNYFLGSDNIIRHRPFLEATFNNSIIYGSLDNELGIDTLEGTMPNYTYNHSIIKTDLNINNSHFNQIKKNINPSLTGDYHLNSNSQAIDAGDPLFPVNNNDDLDGNFRSAPGDMGCYEYVP